MFIHGHGHGHGHGNGHGHGHGQYCYSTVSCDGSSVDSDWNGHPTILDIFDLQQWSLQWAISKQKHQHQHQHQQQRWVRIDVCRRIIQGQRSYY